MTRTDNPEEFKGLPHQLTNEFVPKAESFPPEKNKSYLLWGVERANANRLCNAERLA